jgi:hypothetical protein
MSDLERRLLAAIELAETRLMVRIHEDHERTLERLSGIDRTLTVLTELVLDLNRRVAKLDGEG